MRALAFLLLLGAGGDSATDRLLDVIERRHREAGDPSDARAAAARLGFDRAKILEFMRSEIAWEPYAGVLRDASGTLLVRAGNSVDRSLLLAAMLEAGGEQVRIVRADLAPAEAQKLMDGRKARPEPKESDPKALAAELGADAALLETMIRGRRREDADLLDEVLEAAKTEATRIAEAAGPPAARADVLPKDHVWVQVYDRAKRDWIDLDPAPVEVARKSARPVTPADLAAQRRSGTIRLILNRKSGDKVEPVPLLTVPFDPAAVAWKVVDFILQPERGQLPAMDRLRAMDDKGRVEAFRQAKLFRGGLVLDGKSFGGVPFDLTGKVYEVDTGGRVGPAKGLGRSVGGAFGGLLGGDEKKEEAAPALVSVVLEVALKEPGRAERVHRRAILPGGLPLARYTFLIDGAPLPAGERGRREVASLARNAAALRKILKGEAASLNPHAELPSTLLRFADLRRRALARLAEGGVPVQDRPGLCAETSQVFIDEAAGRLRLRRGIDIFDNPVRSADPRGTLTLGVVDTVLECLVVARGWPGETSRSAWTLLERARLQGAKLEAADREGLREIRRSADAWWSIDPATGTCVGRVPGGAGQGLVEYAWDTAGKVCDYSDLIGFAAATKAGPPGSEEAAELIGKACGFQSGTKARDIAADKIKELNDGLWKGAIGALSGM